MCKFGLSSYAQMRSRTRRYTRLAVYALLPLYIAHRIPLTSYNVF
ncbi:hypothetical protein [Helicobacter sp.]|nr:hypothetical protein [Helicobacter sp.]